MAPAFQAKGKPPAPGMASETYRTKANGNLPEPELLINIPDRPRGKNAKKPRERSLITSQVFQGYESSCKSKLPDPRRKRESVLVRPTKWTWRIQQQAKERDRDAKLAKEKAQKTDFINGAMNNGDGIANGKRTAKEAELRASEVERNKSRRLMNGSGLTGQLGRAVGVANGLSPVTRTGGLDSKTGGKEKALSLLDLPQNVRTKIWSYVVVANDRFIRPSGTFGGEQPDLAMVGRQVRREVLTVFYGENAFAIDVSVESRCLKMASFQQPPAEKGKGKTQAKTAEGKATMLERWSYAVQAGGWLDKIRHWSFLYNFDPSKSDDETLVISVELNELREGMWGAEVIIHRRASCVLPAVGKTSKCAVHNSPSWLNGRVINMLDGAKATGAMQAKCIVALAKDLQMRAEKLMPLRCSPASHGWH